jgi:hypothetical protein
MDQMCMITAGILYPDNFGVVDLIVKHVDFEKAKKIVEGILEKLDADPKYVEKFEPRTDFMIALGKENVESCVLRISTNMEDEDQGIYVADYFLDLDK